MSYIGNSPGVSSQRVVTEEVISGSAKSAFYPVGGYALGYVDVLINGLEVDSADFTAADGVVVTLASAAQVGDTVKIKAYIPRGLSDGYLKAEADARYPRVDTASQGLNSTQQGNARTNINAANKAGETFTGPIVGQNTGGSAVVSQATSATGNASFKLLGATAQNRNWEIFQRYTNGDFGLYDGVGAVDRLIIDVNGNMSLPTGNLVLASGKGIDFSASPNASGRTNEFFDDYEFGNWTPSSVVNQSGTAVTWYNNGCTYTKIGRLVFLKFRVQVAASSGTEIRIYGLPFASGDADSGQGTCLATRTSTNVTVVTNGDHIWIQGTNNYEYHYGAATYQV